MRVDVVPRTSGLSHPFLSGSPRKNGAPAISRPITDPRFHNSTAPKAFAYHVAAFGASRTASIREIVGGGVIGRECTYFFAVRWGPTPSATALSALATLGASRYLLSVV